MRKPYITAAMVGALLPDLAKINLVISNWWVRQWLPVPFSWSALHTTGGVILSVLIVVTLVEPPYRKRVGGLLLFGAGTHLLTDAMLRSVTGRSFPIFWPLTLYEPLTPGLYLSTEPWPTALAIAVAAVLTGIDRRRSRSS